MKPPNNGTAKQELSGNPDDDLPLSFPEWSAVLAADTLEARIKSRRKFAIMGFLRFCKEVRRPASITLIKGYLDELSMQGKLVAEAREALRWFVVAGRRQAREGGGRAAAGRAELRGPEDGGRKTDARPPVGPTYATASAVPLRERASDRSMPSIGAEGMSGPEWEQALVKAARTKGLMWRTEQTYRGWEQRFVAFMFPRNPRLADKADVKAFLEYLAVSLRVSSSTQKQAA